MTPKENNGFHITAAHAVIDVKNSPLMLEVALKKLPTPIGEGTVIEHITIDNKSPKLRKMRQEAQKLKALPEKDRIKPLLSIVKSNLRYAYPWTIKELEYENPELAAQVKEKTGLSSWANIPLTLSEVANIGYCICRHLSVTTLALAKDAGLQGTHLTYQPVKDDPESYIRNVIRKDNVEPLFLSVGVGKSFGNAHAWCELLTSEVEWIPIDPTTGLTGDTKEGFATFQEARYQTYLGQTLFAEGLPQELFGAAMPNLQFLSGESMRKGLYRIGHRIFLKPIGRRGKKHTETKNRPEYAKFEGPLDFYLLSRLTNTGINVEIENVKIAQQNI